MTNETEEPRFEEAVEALVRSLAPEEVPLTLRDRLASITTSPVARPWFLRPMLLPAFIALTTVLILAYVLADRPAATEIGTAPFAGYVTQTDGNFGYRMERPEGWASADLGVGGRRYTSPGFADGGDWLMLVVNNYQVAAAKAGRDATIAQWLLFERASSLESWTADIERLWKSQSTEFSKLETLPNARIYALPQPSTVTPAQDQLVAFIVDDGEPLVAVLTGSGKYGQPRALREDGIYEAFKQMVRSLRAIPRDPNNVTPRLK